MNRVRCPICDRAMDGQGPREWPDWPFCSPRCRLIDLGRWLGGKYRLGTASEETETDLEDSDLEDSDLDAPPNSAVPSAVPNREEA
ncbi:MAG: DNA gyrase inhibitor YacG [Planctomycetes bacterium]|nr:DNA gyrase inhibitor YacG [Planctomycetota bacterium]